MEWPLESQVNIECDFDEYWYFKTVLSMDVINTDHCCVQWWWSSQDGYWHPQQLIYVGILAYELQLLQLFQLEERIRRRKAQHLWSWAGKKQVPKSETQWRKAQLVRLMGRRQKRGKCQRIYSYKGTHWRKAQPVWLGQERGNYQ